MPLAGCERQNTAYSDAQERISRPVRLGGILARAVTLWIVRACPHVAAAVDRRDVRATRLGAGGGR
ncbi:hypothetical protein GCM10023083_71590 [Streptomyces phyllanthi]